MRVSQCCDWFCGGMVFRSVRESWVRMLEPRLSRFRDRFDVLAEHVLRHYVKTGVLLESQSDVCNDGLVHKIIPSSCLAFFALDKGQWLFELLSRSSLKCGNDVFEKKANREKCFKERCILYPNKTDFDFLAHF